MSEPSNQPSDISTKGRIALRSQEVPKLIGQENVFLWRRRVKTAMKSREIWKAVEQECSGTIHDKVVGIITASISDHVLCMLKEEDSALVMWLELENLYATRDAGRATLGEDRIYHEKMASATTGEGHVANMNKLYSKLVGAGGTITGQHKARQMLCSLDSSKWDIFVQLPNPNGDLSYDSVWNELLLE